MNCAECWDAVSAGLDGEASAAERATADEHLARCLPCRRAAERAVLITRLARTELVRPTPDYVDSVLAALGSSEEPADIMLGPPASAGQDGYGTDNHRRPADAAGGHPDGCGCHRTCRCGCQQGRLCQCHSTAA